jgi:hypothetical protein
MSIMGIKVFRDRLGRRDLLALMVRLVLPARPGHLVQMVRLALLARPAQRGHRGRQELRARLVH